MTCSITGWYHVTVAAVVSLETWAAQLTQCLNKHCLPTHLACIGRQLALNYDYALRRSQKGGVHIVEKCWTLVKPMTSLSGLFALGGNLVKSC